MRVLVDVISARGGKFGLANASNSSADIFVVLLPRNSLELKRRQTSGIIKCPAIMRELRRLASASFWSSMMDACEPVRMTGFPRLCSMKLKADAVYARESVP